MLFWISVLALSVAALISKRLCTRASAALTYGSLFWALTISIAVAGGWFMHRFTSLNSVTVWRIMALVFHHGCFTFPIAFVISYCVFMSAGRRRRARPEGAPGFLPSTLALTVVLALLIAGVYASRIEPKRIQVTHTEFRTPYLKAGSPPLKIVQLSDLHMEEFGYREKRALKIVERLDPDIIVLTGDYTNSWEKTADVRRFMKRLHAGYGIYAIHGNWNPIPRAREFFEGTAVHVLENESAVVDTESGRVVIAGVLWDGVKDAEDVLARADTKNSYVILLSHMPDTALYAPKSVDLVLAGHTHGGQVRLPLLGPVMTFSKVGRNRSAGLSELANGGWLYVNRGLGMEGAGAPRIRFLCQPEISVFTIRPEADNGADS